MKAVLDTNAFIYLNDFRIFNEIFTVSDVIDEVKDKTNMLKLASINVTIMEPNGFSIKEIKGIASQTGDLAKLSLADIRILALAKERGLTLISDDYNVQNVAQKAGIKYMSLFSKKISKLVKWKNYCTICKEFSNNKNTCPNCGGALVLRTEKAKFIKK